MTAHDAETRAFYDREAAAYASQIGRGSTRQTRPALEAAYAAAGPWSETTVRETEGGGYDGVART